METINKLDMVSVHGGHSGSYCNHATDDLDDIIKAYADKNFTWVGITEHMPPVSDRFLFPDEIENGLDQRKMVERFHRYILHARALQDAYRGKLPILVGFETEMVDGSLIYARDLREKYQPDYIVGSVHYVRNLPIDMNRKIYDDIVEMLGGHISLYIEYFDLQYEMLTFLRPEVVGHFDLVRIFDPDYRKHLAHPEVMARIERNLKMIRSVGAILDFNLAALSKGADEPYISRPILEKVIAMDVKLAPGDDSHGVATVGRHMDRCFSILSELGVKGPFPSPVNPEKMSGYSKVIHDSPFGR